MRASQQPNRTLGATRALRGARYLGALVGTGILILAGTACDGQVTGPGDQPDLPDAGGPADPADAQASDDAPATSPDGPVGSPDGSLPPPSPTQGIWLNAEEIAWLPTSGDAWEQLLAEADLPIDSPDLSNQHSPENTRTMAKALVFARTGDEQYRAEVRQAIEDAIGTEDGGRTLALGRNLAAYVIAADLIDLPAYDSAFDAGTFRPWLEEVRDEELEGRTLVSTHEVRPNNWGTMAGGSRVAVAVYLGDSQDLERSAQVFRGWLGDRETYSDQSDPGFVYDEVEWWQCNPAEPVGINPVGCTRDGHSLDGVIPDDQRRAGGFTWPPPKENYVYSGLAGALVQAEILHRAGYDAWNWEDQAILRAYEWLHEQADFPAEGDDRWQPHLINRRYGTNFPAEAPAQVGKNMGWTDWSHPE